MAVITERHLAAVCKPKNLDFSQFSNGEFIDNVNEIPGFGVKIDVKTGSPGKCQSPKAQIIDTEGDLADGCGSDPVDSDLSSNFLGKAVIIGSKGTTCVANDCRFGGTVTFTFSKKINLKYFDLLDIDEDISATLTFFDDSVVELGSAPIIGDNGFYRWSVNSVNVKKLAVKFKRSGAIPNVVWRECPGEPGTFGDPHFKTWAGHKFDYHGQCDLVLTSAPNAAEGKGLDVHVRATHKKFFSYISATAIRIGNEVFEVANHGKVYLNGNENIDFEKDVTISGYPIKFNDTPAPNGRLQTMYNVHLSEHERIEIKVFNVFISVKIRSPSAEHFMGSSGIMGDFYTGLMFSRDRQILTNPDEFGAEWQVNADDGNIFRTVQEPQFPAKCLAPEPMDQSRMLRHGITYQQAEEACNFWNEDKEACIYDILATGDLEMAGAY